MDVFQALILGIVQGLTELLPISSSGHLDILPWIFGWTKSAQFNVAFEAFDVALHFGTFLAIAIFFFKDWIELIKGGFNQIVKKEDTKTRQDVLVYCSSNNTRGDHRISFR